MVRHLFLNNRADLQPGDVLYLPGGWFHQVESPALSASVAVWSDRELSAFINMEERLTFPATVSWEQSMAFFRRFIDNLLPTYPGIART